MAAILLTTVGTMGDVEPYVHLAEGLAARGHHVRVASHALHAPRFASFDFVPASADFSIEEMNAVLDAAAREAEPLDQFATLVRRLFLREAETQYERYLEATQGIDLAVCHRFDYLGQEAAIARGLRWASVSITPEVFRSAEAPPYPFFRLGRWFHRKAWDAVEAAASKLNAEIARTLSSIGRPPRALGIAGADSPHLNLLAASPNLVPSREDWPSSVVITGPWVGAPVHAEPPPEVVEFLARNPSPIVITFGSMGGTDVDETNALLSEALVRVRHPTIVQSGYQGLGGNVTEALLTIGSVPHDVLLPKAACVVHHAGAGTSIAVARAGVPSVPVPHLFDQYYWAGMLHRAGVAPRPVFRKALTAKALAERICEALRSEKMQRRAMALGRVLRAENGVATAINAIETLCSPSRLREGLGEG